MLPLTQEQYIALTPPITKVDGDVIDSLFARGLVMWWPDDPQLGRIFGPTSLGALAVRVYEQYQTVNV